MSDMPTHTPFPGGPDIPQPDLPAPSPDMPEIDPGSSPVEMPDDQPFSDDGEPAPYR